MMSLFTCFDFLNKGGWVAWVLAVLSALLWYALGYRYLYLQSKTLLLNPETALNKKEFPEDILGSALTAIQMQIANTKSDLETALQFEWHRFRQQIASHRATVKAIVIVAPLLGLMGTVIGMIETFDSLQDAALFSQGGGIAGGISQALITTQMGLVVAIPGLLVGKKLDQQEKNLDEFLERVIGQVLLKGASK